MITNDELRLQAQSVASQLLSDIQGARSVLLASADGFDLASAGVHDDGSRLAAMTSSIAAIGQVVSQETEIGEPQCLVVDATKGFLIVRSTQYRGAHLVINVLTTRDALLGMAMHMVAAAARNLEAA